MFWILVQALVIGEVTALQFEGDQHPKHHKHPAKALHFTRDVEVNGTKNKVQEKKANTTKHKSNHKKNVIKHSKKHKGKEVLGGACWSYENTKHWETVYATCRDENQSPIALTTQCRGSSVGCTPSSQPLGKHIESTPVAGAYLSNNGHFLELVGPAYFSTVTLGKYVWKASRVQFHTPAEHTINGDRYPAEMQIVHKPVSDHNKWTLVTSVLIKEGYTKSSFLSAIGFDMLNLPRDEGDKMYVGSTVDLKDGLETSLNGDFAGYEGTLTSPPCTKDVLWFVAENPLEASAMQIGNLQRRFPEGNNRPLHPIGSRMIYRDFSQWSSHASGWSLVALSAALLVFAATY